MPLQKLAFRPGVNLENTNYTNEGGWYQMDKVRFRSGSAEKIGGWAMATNYNDDPNDSDFYLFNYQGVARNLVNWASLTGENLIGVGTHLRYYILYGGVYHNVTPVRQTQTGLSNPFSAIEDSSIIAVTDASHGAQPGDFVIFSGASAVAGITAETLNSNIGFQVVSVESLNSYTIDVGVLASATATGGGTVTATYEIPVGLPVYTLGNGFSAGVWNGAALGAGSTTLAYTSGTGDVLLNIASTTINVASTTGFTASGTILIEAEVITYSGLTATSFTGCVRGTSQSTAANHALQPVAGTPPPIAVRQVVALTGTTGWGLASVVSGVGQQMRLWTSDNYGEDLLLAPRGGGIYYWNKDTSAFARATAVRDDTDPLRQYVPVATNQISVSDVNRFVIAFGANPYIPGQPTSTFDPMLVRWSDQENYLDWVPTAINQAGEQRLSTGSFIMTSAKMRQEILIWTDSALYSMQYLGPPFVWGINPLMSNLSIMSPNAVATVNNVAYWMGTDKFYMYDGRVQTMPCDVRQYVFSDFSANQQYQTFACTNEGFNEIWWFYVTQTEEQLASTQARDPVVDRYVVYNHLEKIWYYGQMSRTAWVDSPLQLGPVAALGTTDAGRLVVHEQGTDDLSTNVTTPITAYIQSADFDISEGNEFMFVWRMLPDISFTGSNVANPQVTVSLIPRQNPGAPYGTPASATTVSAKTYTPVVKQYLVQEFTQQLNTRVRARQMALRIESNTLGVQWQNGVNRIDARKDGRKS